MSEENMLNQYDDPQTIKTENREIAALGSFYTNRVRGTIRDPIYDAWFAKYVDRYVTMRDLAVVLNRRARELATERDALARSLGETREMYEEAKTAEQTLAQRVTLLEGDLPTQHKNTIAALSRLVRQALPDNDGLTISYFLWGGLIGQRSLEESRAENKTLRAEIAKSEQRVASLSETNDFWRGMATELVSYAQYPPIYFNANDIVRSEEVVGNISCWSIEDGLPWYRRLWSRLTGNTS